MTKFNITTYKFQMDGEEYFLKPLCGEHIDLLFKVITESKGLDKDDDSMSPEAMSSMHTLAVQTMKESYPDMDSKDLERFVTKNLFKLIEHVINANMDIPKKPEE